MYFRTFKEFESVDLFRSHSPVGDRSTVERDGGQSCNLSGVAGGERDASRAWPPNWPNWSPRTAGVLTRHRHPDTNKNNPQPCERRLPLTTPTTTHLRYTSIVLPEFPYTPSASSPTGLLLNQQQLDNFVPPTRWISLLCSLNHHKLAPATLPPPVTLARRSRHHHPRIIAVFPSRSPLTSSSSISSFSSSPSSPLLSTPNIPLHSSLFRQLAVSCSNPAALSAPPHGTRRRRSKNTDTVTESRSPLHAPGHQHRTRDSQTAVVVFQIRAFCSNADPPVDFDTTA
ncbi:hypothetical protein EX30DRAFT_377206 [Ascodesmis nigricans]|uniref:Uncharacterized protein n=1 Tax=Ascodesmis nigricans TaxID=341454 RepID=A0A4S2N8G8_9PEZI|nr:hypothetical protein EX30DRAFT_377206 [Ascodesmis nigricans]